jgi:hypothetical protein
MSTPLKEWTIMVYMAGDNNLNDDMIRAINELRSKVSTVGRRIASTSTPYPRNGISVFVEFDGEHPVVPSIRRDFSFDTTAPDNFACSSRPVEVKEPPQTPATPTGDPVIGETEKRIGDFVDYCVKTQPAKKYALILSGHSDSFLGRTLLVDQQPSNVATLQGIRQLIKDKFKYHGKLDILGFDGCVMNTIEVAYEFRDVVKIFLGSQGSIPNYTWDYARIAEALMDFDVSFLDEKKVVDAIVTAIRDYNCPYAFGGRSVDIAALQLDKIEGFSNPFNFSAAVMTIILKAFPPETIIGSRLLQIFLQAHWNCQTAMFDQSVDLIDFLKRLKTECIRVIRQSVDIDPENSDGSLNDSDLTVSQIFTLVGNADISNPTFTDIVTLIYIGCYYLLNKLEDVVLDGAFVGANYRFCNGLSIFMPWSFVAFWMTRVEYRKLDFTKAFRGWHVFQGVYAARTARPPVPLADIPVFDAALQALIDYLSRAQTMKMADAEEKSFLDINFDTIDSLFAEAFADTKFTPPMNRGLETYFDHFGRTNNIKPDLDIYGEFPQGVELGSCKTIVEPPEC